MVGILIGFIINNILWLIFTIFLITLLQNKSITQTFKKTHVKSDATDDMEEASDTDLMSAFRAFNRKPDSVSFNDEKAEVE